MIPIKLQLKNFLSYGSEIQTIDFSTYSLICLSGKNGHGKSALLDAMTWALWGQARKISATTKADQGLVRLGHTQMMVVLDFECAGQVYRIRREYMITYGKPYAVLEFGILNAHTNLVSSLTDKTIRDTQEKIEKTIRIDFNSFCNSAFLRQGNANEFSQKSPQDRKEILATILGLNHYDNLKKRALEKAKAASLELQAIEVIQKKIEQELKEQDTLLKELQTLEDIIQALADQEKSCATTQEVIATELALLYKEKEKHTIATITAKQLTEKKRELQKQQETLVEQWTAIENTKNTIENLQELKEKHTNTIKKIMEYQKILQETLNQKEQLLTLKEQLHHLNQEHQKTQSTLIQEKKKEIEQFDLELTNKINIQQSLTQQTLTLTKELEHQKKECSELQQYATSVYVDEKNYVALKNRFEKRKLFYHNFLSQGTFANNELEQLKKKVILADDEGAPSCALCEQNLSASRKRFLKNKFLHTKQTITHRVQRLKKIVEKLKELLVHDHKNLELYAQQKEHHAIAIIKLEQITKIIAQKQELIIINTNEYNLYEEIINQHKQTKIKLQTDHEAFLNEQAQLLNTNVLYSHTTNMIKKIEYFLQHNPYHASDHQTAQKDLDALEQKISTYQAMQKKLDEQTQRAQQIELLSAELITLEHEIREINKTIDSYNYITATENNLLEKKRIQGQQEKKYADQKNELLEQRGALTMKKTRLAQTAEEYAAQQKIITELEQTKKDYLAIALATGKDGIQALLIENTIPEIEQEANLLLAKLTNNQSQILIESLRDLKKGGTKETLDIKISDSYGIRPYEMFSGGEAFRIDFALRIAISKLLARRAGTSLQTLIIDEGFGSQDEEGLSHIMDALHKIQEDFSKIIIVSHLTSMKEQFPVHFFVSKGPNGSMVTVLEQD